MHQWIRNDKNELSRLFTYTCTKITSLKQLNIQSELCCGYINSNRISNWSTGRFTIKDVISEIKDEFERSPPMPSVLYDNNQQKVQQPQPPYTNSNINKSSSSSAVRSTNTSTTHNSLRVQPPSTTTAMNIQIQSPSTSPQYNTSRTNNNNTTVSNKNELNSIIDNYYSHIDASHTVPNTAQPTPSNSTSNQSIPLTSLPKSNSVPQSMDSLKQSQITDTGSKSIHDQTFTMLDGMSINELNDINNDTDLFDELAEQLDGVPNVNTIKNDLYNDIESISLQNIQTYQQYDLPVYQQQIDQLKQQIQLNYNQSIELQQQYNVRRNELLNQYNINDIQSQLNNAVDQSDTDSELATHDYSLINNDNITSYIEQYVNQRVLFHQRNIKRERLNDTNISSS